jgi:Kef-type K+ transport system membrane component KefB
MAPRVLNFQNVYIAPLICLYYDEQMKPEYMDTSYYAVTIQWMLFLGLVLLIMLPALFLRLLAKRKNKSGWLYFAAGICVAIFGMVLARLAVECLKLLNESEQNAPYLGIVYFALSILFIYTGYAVLRQRIITSQ